jgi:mono/diheme cytochrome c family protein
MTRRVSIVLVALALAAAACGGSAHSDVTAVRDPESVLAGADLYAANCAQCHGAALEGGSATQLVSKELGHPDSDFVEWINNGKGNMPAFPDLTGDEVQAIVDFVRSVQAAALEE